MKDMSVQLIFNHLALSVDGKRTTIRRNPDGPRGHLDLSSTMHT